MKPFTAALVLGLTALTFGLAGCGEPATPPGVETAPPPSTVDAHDDHAHPHGHPHEGPHHGELIELGNEEYHAEVVHTDSEVTIYVLDGTATKSVAIDAPSITMNHPHDGSPLQFTLEASSEQGDAEGKSSRFVSHDPDLLTHIDEEHAQFRLALTIDGKSYNGTFEHSHENDHDHAH